MVDALAVGGPTWAQMYARHAHADRPAVVRLAGLDVP